MLFSIVVPICNEEENIPELYRRLTTVLEILCTEEARAPDDFEVLLVDDGSTDSSWRLIEDLHAKDPRIKGVSFSRNFGHHLALTAGLDHVSGEVVVLLDADLQDPPEEIPALYREFKKGYHLVYGRKIERKDPWLKKATSKMFWWALRKFSNVEMPEGQTMMRVMSKQLVDVLRDMREYARFVHGMMAWPGFEYSVVEIEHHPRQKGKSKYNFFRLFRLAANAITSFSISPLRFITYLGLFVASLNFVLGLYFIFRKLAYGIPVSGYASIIVSIFFVGGVQILMLGILGEYVGRIYQSEQKRPLYVMKARTGLDRPVKKATE